MAGFTPPAKQSPSSGIGIGLPESAQRLHERWVAIAIVVACIGIIAMTFLALKSELALEDQKQHPVYCLTDLANEFLLMGELADNISNFLDSGT